MFKTIKIAAAAALFSSIALGGVFAADGYQPGEGDYYNGITPPQVTQDTMDNGVVDMGRTGSIRSNGGATYGNTVPEAEAGDMRYYDGARPDNQ